MFRISSKDVLALLLLLFLAAIPVMIGNDQSKEYASSMFFISLLLIFNNEKKHQIIACFLSPPMLLLLYVNISFMVGSFAFYNMLVLTNTPNLANYITWEYFDLSLSFVLLANTFVYISHIIFRRRLKLIVDQNNPLKKTEKTNLLLALFLCAPFFFVPLDASFFGGSGDLSMIPTTLLVLFLVFEIAKSGNSNRWIVYIAVFLLFAFLSVHSKREAIFLIFPILLVESTFNIKQISFKFFIQMFTVSIFLLLLIILMSIARGYGGYDVTGEITSAIPFVLDYISTELFWAYLFNNLEVNYTFYHSFQSIEYVLKDVSLLSGGSTIIKSIFVLFPRSVWESKPSSIIDLYTTYHDPSFRRIGGSWPINVYSEFFWNFHFLSLPLILFLLIGFNSMFISFLENLKSANWLVVPWGLFIYMNWITYARGSGLDMYLVYSAFAIIFWFMVVNLRIVLSFSKEGRV